MEDYQRKIIDAFIEQELMIANLYERFAGYFPEYRDFWYMMAKEEKEHAGWIQQLLNGVIADKVYFAEGKTRTYTVNAFKEYVQNIIRNIDDKVPNMLKALAVARDLEMSLIERNSFRYFDGDSVRVKQVLSYLEKQQKVHCKNISDELARTVQLQESKQRPRVRPK